MPWEDEGLNAFICLYRGIFGQIVADESIKEFVNKMNCIEGVIISIEGEIKLILVCISILKLSRTLLKNTVEQSFAEKLRSLFFDDEGMRENNYDSIVKRVETTFKDKQYMRRVSGSRQHWIDEEIEAIADGICQLLKREARNI